MRGENFDRHRFVQVDVEGFIDRAHAATPENSSDLIFPQPPTDERVVGPAAGGARRGGRDASVSAGRLGSWESSGRCSTFLETMTSPETQVTMFDCSSGQIRMSSETGQLAAGRAPCGTNCTNDRAFSFWDDCTAVLASPWEPLAIRVTFM